MAYYFRSAKKSYLCREKRRVMMEKESRMGLYIEGAVCRCFGIEMSELRTSKRLDRQFTDCLHFIFYYRHYLEGLSRRQITEIYGRKLRNISYAFSKIKDGIQTQPYYIEMHRKIMSAMIMGTFENPECPREKKE